MVNSSKTKVPLKFGWLLSENKYHIAQLENNYFNSLSGIPAPPAYICLCDTSKFLEYADNKNNSWYKNWYIWPDGTECTEVLCIDTVCLKCLNLYGEDLTFLLIKAKLGVKNPFD